MVGRIASPSKSAGFSELHLFGRIGQTLASCKQRTSLRTRCPCHSCQPRVDLGFQPFRVQKCQANSKTHPWTTPILAHTDTTWHPEVPEASLKIGTYHITFALSYVISHNTSSAGKGHRPLKATWGCPTRFKAATAREVPGSISPRMATTIWQLWQLWLWVTAAAPSFNCQIPLRASEIIQIHQALKGNWLISLYINTSRGHGARLDRRQSRKLPQGDNQNQRTCSWKATLWNNYETPTEVPVIQGQAEGWCNALLPCSLHGE